MSDARHDGMSYGRNQGQGQGHSREVDRQSPTGLIYYFFFLCVYAFMCYAQCATILGSFHSVYKILACKPTRNASRLLKSEAGDGHFACARGQRRRPERRRPGRRRSGRRRSPRAPRLK